MHKGLIVGVHKKHNIPDTALELIFKNFPSAFGGVVPTEIEGKKQLLVSLTDNGLTAEQMQEVMKEFLNQDKTFFFGNFPKGYSGTDIQPFTLIADATDMPLLTAFMDGNYAPFAKEKSEHSAEYHAFEEMLKPTLKELFDSEAVGKDINKLMNVIKNDTKLRKTMELMSPDRGQITLVGVTGEIFSPVMKNDLFREFPWGSMSNHLGYAEASSVTAGVRRLFQSKPTRAEPVAPAPAPADDKPAIVNKPPEKPKTDTLVPANAGASKVTALLHEREASINLSQKIVTFPVNLYGRALKNWCNSTLGYLPRNWRQNSAEKPLTAYVAEKIAKKYTGEIKSFKDPRLSNAIGTTVEKKEPVAEAKPLSAAERRRAQLAAKKATGEQPSPAEKPAEPAKKESETIPIIPKEELTGLEVWTKRFTAYDAKEIVVDPEVMVAAFQSDIPSYADQTGRKGLEMIFYWDDKDIDEHIKKWPIATRVLIRNLITLYRDVLANEEAPAQQRKAG